MKKTVKDIARLRKVYKDTIKNLSEVVYVEFPGIYYQLVAITVGSYIDDSAETIITEDGLVFQTIIRNKTGTTLELIRPEGLPYNWGANDTVSYTVYHLAALMLPNSWVRCKVNASSILVSGADLRVGGAVFVPNTPYEMIVETPNGVDVFYYFLEL